MKEQQRVRPCEVANPTGLGAKGLVRSNLVAARLDETENRAQRAGNLLVWV
jgi:hypothetical protein